MSASPLARQSRKSLSAFARPPSQLSRSTRDLDDGPSTPTSSSSHQNAFATPVRDHTERERPRYRSSAVGVGVGTVESPGPITPHGAHITYSPYATTPPAGLSKSSSIPFDMAANARAAKQYEEERKREARRASLNPVYESTSGKKKRFVRKKSLWKRMVELPSNVIDTALIQMPNSVEDVLPPARFANPIALALYIIHWFLLAPLRSPQADDGGIIRHRSGVDDRWGRYEEEPKARRGIVGTRTAFLVTFLLFTLSAANAVWLFTRFRNYDLLLRTAKDPISSPHASPAPSPTARKSTSTHTSPAPVDDNVVLPSTASPAEKYARIAAHWLWIFTKWAARSVLSAFGARPPRTSGEGGGDDRIQSLHVWEPPEFCLAFFCAYAPSAPVVAYLITAPHPFLTPVIHAMSIFFLTQLAANYAQLVKDRMLLSAEVMREYDRRFVYKRIFATKVDRGVGTSDP